MTEEQTPPGGDGIENHPDYAELAVRGELERLYHEDGRETIRRIFRNRGVTQPELLDAIVEGAHGRFLAFPEDSPPFPVVAEAGFQIGWAFQAGMLFARRVLKGPPPLLPGETLPRFPGRAAAIDHTTDVSQLTEPEDEEDDDDVA